MGTWLADLRIDFRRGVRLLRKSPGFTLAAVLTLALGIGATSAIFSVLHSIVLRPLPFPNPEQLVSVQEVNQSNGRTRPPTIEVHDAWRKQSRSLLGVGTGITGGVDMSVTGPAGATRISLGGIALDTLSILGTRPIPGRWFEPDEVTVEGDTAGTLVISYELWQSWFNGDPNVVGKTIPGWDAAWGRTIIGVMPPDFWVHPSMAKVKGWFAFNVARFPGGRSQTIARLKPGVDRAQASSMSTPARTSSYEPSSPIPRPSRRQYARSSRTSIRRSPSTAWRRCASGCSTRPRTNVSGCASSACSGRSPCSSRRSAFMA